MISSIHFRNFRVLRDAELALSPVTVIIGPNGSGKSTVALALKAARSQLLVPNHLAVFNPQLVEPFNYSSLTSLTPLSPGDVAMTVKWSDASTVEERSFEWNAQPRPPFEIHSRSTPNLDAALREVRSFSLEAAEIVKPVQLSNEPDLDENGGGLARVLTVLQDKFPERWDALNLDIARWIPEFDRILLDTPKPGHRSFHLRTAKTRQTIDADRLSEGSVLAITLLTLTHVPKPPKTIVLEEPDRGMHPRLLRELLDAIYRLAYPVTPEMREPVQVIVTTHSPYFIDLFRDHPEEIVIAEKDGLQAHFRPLAEMSNLEEVLKDSHLGDVWFSGALGGVPSGT